MRVLETIAMVVHDVECDPVCNGWGRHNRTAQRIYDRLLSGSDTYVTPEEKQAIAMWVSFACAHAAEPWSQATKQRWAALPNWAKGL